MFYVHDVGWGWGWWILTTVGMIAFWGLVIYAIVWLIRGGRPQDAWRPTSERPDPDAPQEILRRRLARGEISLEEYERLRAALDEPPGDPVVQDEPSRDRTAV